jgi:[CysO sulfur-carrier protein]-S-L-cysteine hydrolase
MITLQMPPDLIEKLAIALSRAGQREIGGVLVGEHMGTELFRVAGLSIQRAGGNDASFVRNPQNHAAFIERFFRRTCNAYERFNYLGEWHSHPSFEVAPSAVGVHQMQMIVEEEPDAPLFAILLVLRLQDNWRLRLSATAFKPARSPEAVKLVVVSRPQDDPSQETPSWWHRLCRGIRPAHVRIIQEVTIPS